jgi:hypothetical protein
LRLCGYGAAGTPRADEREKAEEEEREGGGFGDGAVVSASMVRVKSRV